MGKKKTIINLIETPTNRKKKRNLNIITTQAGTKLGVTKYVQTTKHRPPWFTFVLVTFVHNFNNVLNSMFMSAVMCFLVPFVNLPPCHLD